MSELIHKLGIDWKLLIAQAVNFVVLLWLLKKFLYGPVLELLRKRREDIKEGAQNAEKIAQELRQIEQRRAAELERVKKEAEIIIQEAKQAAKARGEELINQTEAKIAGLIAEAKRHLEEERIKMMDQAGKDVKELVFMVAEKVLEEQLPKDIHEKFVEEAVRRLKK
ncbi:MAG: F0F1 ATP synthase subunit B [bacterium]|nr:F0F1 ATP synthase subunit B [bacterium]